MRKYIGLAGAASLLALSPAAPLTAPAAAQSNDKVCMTKRTSKRGGGKSVAVIVTKKSKESSMKARGFRKTSCRAKKAERENYQKQMCRFASIAPASVQAEFQRDHGATPAELCEAAK